MVEFNPSEPLTVGMELELQLLNEQTLELADGILPLLERYPGSTNVQSEFVQEVVEIVSDPCDDIAELDEHFRTLVADVEARATELGMRLCGAGTHPFSTRLAAVTPKARYFEIEKKAGYLSHTRITFATHVHIGVRTPEELIRLTGELIPYLPALVALSANSPFWRGHQTGFASYRHRALAATGTYGIPPRFDDWADFNRFYKTARRAGMCESLADFHWEVRPQPALGTIEVRTMDATATVSEAVAIASLVRALVAYLRDTPADERPSALPGRLPDWAERENHFRASQAALDAACLIDTRGRLVPVRDTVATLLDELEPVARDLGEARYLEHVRWMLHHDLGYERQLSAYEQTDSLEQVVRGLVSNLRADLEGYRPGRSAATEGPLTPH